MYERDRRIGTGAPLVEMPTFAEFSKRYLAERYLEEDTSHLAAPTLGNHRNRLREGGPVMRHLGSLPLNAISQAALRDWWNREILQGGRKPSSAGKRYVSTLWAVFRYAVELELRSANPIHAFREHLSLRARTKAGRAEAEVLSVRPVEDPAVLARLLAEAEREARGLHQLQPDALLFPTFAGADLRHRTWPKIVKRAEAYHRDGTAVRMKDLRDTFGSWLVSAGVPVQYVAEQLGHAGTQVTEKHYARWVGGDEYVEPPRLRSSEVPADLLARVEGSAAPIRARTS